MPTANSEPRAIGAAADLGSLVAAIERADPLTFNAMGILAHHAGAGATRAPLAGRRVPGGLGERSDAGWGQAMLPFRMARAGG